MYFQKFCSAFTFTSHHNIYSLFYLRDKIDSAHKQNSYMYLTGGMLLWCEHIFMSKMCFVSSWWLQYACLRVIWLKIIRREVYFCGGDNRVFSVIFLSLPWATYNMYIWQAHAYMHVYFVFGYMLFGIMVRNIQLEVTTSSQCCAYIRSIMV